MKGRVLMIFIVFSTMPWIKDGKTKPK